MQYGYFDNDNREYVITNPRTPAPWVNYLGSPEYGSIISNNAGGYSFVRSGADGRVLRYRFNADDTPGRYVYLRDNASGEYGCLSRFPDECRHGTGYTLMTKTLFGVRAELAYYVPLDARHEVWHVRLKNTESCSRDVFVTGYAEFTNHPNYEQDGVNLQYSQFMTRTEFGGNRVTRIVHANVKDLPEVSGHLDVDAFLGLSGAEVSSWCSDRQLFLGPWRGYDSPESVERGELPNTASCGGNGCGALCTKLSLAPGEEKEFSFLLGQKSDSEAAALLKEYDGGCRSVKEELDALKADWNAKLCRLSVKTPDDNFNQMMNTWNPLNCFMTFTWSRAASFVYCGLRNGYGYRDTVQDIGGILHLDTQAAEERLSFMLSAQAANGGGLPLVKYTHTPGQEDTPDEESYRQSTGHPAWRADDALWLFPTVNRYLAETGDISYLSKVIPFADKGEATVYEHLARAVAFSLERPGHHGLPAGLWADWNDCLRLGEKGESSFVAMQLYLAIELMAKFSEALNKPEEAQAYRTKAAELRGKIDSLCLEEDRYIRGFTEAGEIIGSAANPEASCWLNPQSWAVISGLASGERADRILQTVYDNLNTPYGAALMMPPFREHSFPGALSVIYNPGMKENAGIFCQTQGWLILAEALCGNGDRAWEYYVENSPAAFNDRAELRQMEPYVYGQFTESTLSMHPGRSHVHWLTGTASTIMSAAVEGILGLRPDFEGLLLCPAIPSEWEHFEMRKFFRGCWLNITVENPKHSCSGFRSMTVNGEKLSSAYIPAEKMTAETEITLWIS